MSFHKKIILLRTFLCLPFLIIPLILLIICLNDKIEKDIVIWSEKNAYDKINIRWNFLLLFIEFKDFRSVYYFRLKKNIKERNFIVKYILSIIYIISKFVFKEMPTLMINGNIGGGLLLFHAFSTIISPEKMGDNCKIWQDVTIGFDDKMRAPIIGNNVRISAGAKLIGGIKIGDNVEIGPNTLVVRNIPDNSVVVCQPSYIVKKEGKFVL